MTDRVIRDGKVAVAYSPGFGAGWTSWNSDISPFEPKVIEMIEAGRQGEITPEWCRENLGVDYVCCAGVEDLEIEWVPLGQGFDIREYGGSESVEVGNRAYAA